MSVRHKYGFLLSVGAQQEIAGLCPDGNLRNLRPLLLPTAPESVEMLVILSRWHERARALEEGDGYEETPLTRDELLALPVAEFQRLQSEALDAMLRDQGRTVEAEPGKKETAPKSS